MNDGGLRSDEVQERLEWLLDQDGLAVYVRESSDSDPATWDDDDWEELRVKLWADCFDGERYCWQPMVPLIRSIYETQTGRLIQGIELHGPVTVVAKDPDEFVKKLRKSA